MFRSICTLALVIAAGASPSVGWPTGAVKHRFFDTDNGQLHYVVGNHPRFVLPWTAPPFVFLHGHPRSTVEFKYLAQELGGPFFVAVDYFGMGMSDEYLGQGGNDTFCSFQKFASYVLKILDHEQVGNFVSVGSLKGAHPAIELAAQAGSRVNHLVIMNPLILTATAKKFIDGMLIPKLQKASFNKTGAHLLAAWNDPSSAPVPMSSDQDVLINEEKTIDELHCMANGWKYDVAWTAYNDENVPRLQLVDTHAKTLVLFGSVVVADLVTYKLDPYWSEAQIAKALTHNKTIVLEGAGEAMTGQNASFIARTISEFVQSSTEQINV